jgi:hypothetical protein
MGRGERGEEDEERQRDIERYSKRQRERESYIKGHRDRGTERERKRFRQRNRKRMLAIAYHSWILGPKSLNQPRIELRIFNFVCFHLLQNFSNLQVEMLQLFFV